jgi:pimeloyl-ACP methyl ester carboxylesterase
MQEHKMPRRTTIVFLLGIFLGMCALFLGFRGTPVPAEDVKIELKDGRILSGGLGYSEGISAPPLSPSGNEKPVSRIYFLDDGLRRTFIPFRQIAETMEQELGEKEEVFDLDQRFSMSGQQIYSVGSGMRPGPFDEYGRRIVQIKSSALGSIRVIQAITRITPTYVQAQGVNYVWDMRLATSGFSRDYLDDLLAKQLDMTNLDDRKRLARFYLQCQRYQDAANELESIVEDFPDDPTVEESLEPILRGLRQTAATQLLDELELRRRGGQHSFVREKLEIFPSEGVSSIVLQSVQQLLSEYGTINDKRTEAVASIQVLIDGLEDVSLHEPCKMILDEIRRDLNPATLPRLDSYFQLQNSSDLLPEEILALALSGWTVGSNTAVQELPVALSLYQVRDLVRRYLLVATHAERRAILEEMRAQEGATCLFVSEMLDLMRPPLETPGLAELVSSYDTWEEIEIPREVESDADIILFQQGGLEGDDVGPSNGAAALFDQSFGDGGEEDSFDEPGGAMPGTSIPEVETIPEADLHPGMFEIEVPSYGSHPPYRYWVQLPPEYDPDRRYPAIVTLHGAGTNPQMQLDWWCGSWRDGLWRAGQATRRGYIVIAPQWAPPTQGYYEYSAREHGAVLYTLRDAFRRFSIDSDKVFLSGHSMGGDAAWDIGLAHPDLWAGVIPIVATVGRYATRYWENSRYLPMYIVLGEIDGGRTKQNSIDIDRYMSRGHNVTVVEYRGRGHEGFSDEIQRIFEWASLFQRDFFRRGGDRDFEVSTMRPWDNFFWWVELDAFPSRTMVDPFDWPPPQNTQPASCDSRLTATNGVTVRTGAARAAVWLSPDMVDFERRVTVTVNGTRITPANGFVEGDLEAMLEDARTRCDRQHVFWVRYVKN